MSEPLLQDRRRSDTTVHVIASKLETMSNGQLEMRADIKEMVSAITKLAVIDERQGQASLAQDRTFKVLEKLETRFEVTDARIDALEKTAPMADQIQSWVLAAVWAFAGLAAMFIMKKAGLL